MIIQTVLSEREVSLVEVFDIKDSPTGEIQARGYMPRPRPMRVTLHPGYCVVPVCVMTAIEKFSKSDSLSADQREELKRILRW